MEEEAEEKKDKTALKDIKSYGLETQDAVINGVHPSYEYFPFLLVSPGGGVMKMWENDFSRNQ